MIMKNDVVIKDVKTSHRLGGIGSISLETNVTFNMIDNKVKQRLA